MVMREIDEGASVATRKADPKLQHCYLGSGNWVTRRHPCEFCEPFTASRVMFWWEEHLTLELGGIGVVTHLDTCRLYCP
jgi:hypothetical protein